MNQIDENYKSLNDIRTTLMVALMTQFSKEDTKTIKKPLKEFIFPWYDNKILVRSSINPVAETLTIESYLVSSSKRILNKSVLTWLPKLTVDLIDEYPNGLVCAIGDQKIPYSEEGATTFSEAYLDELYGSMG